MPRGGGRGRGGKGRGGGRKGPGRPKKYNPPPTANCKLFTDQDETDEDRDGGGGGDDQGGFVYAVSAVV